MPSSSRLELALNLRTCVNTERVLSTLSSTDDMLHFLANKCMVLSTVAQGTFYAAEEVLSDVRLVWHNCRTFNALGSDIVRLADALQKDFEARCGAAACSAGTSLLLAEGTLLLSVTC